MEGNNIGRREKKDGVVFFFHKGSLHLSFL
jgi:hypothetical protein